MDAKRIKARQSGAVAAWRKRRIDRTGNGRSSARRSVVKFTLIELLLVVAIIAILASILMPALGVARNTARKSVCAGQLKQWSQVFINYAGDFDEYFPLGAPRPSNWPYGGYWNCYYCPLRELYFSNVSRNTWGSGLSINGCPAQSKEPFSNWVGYNYSHFSYMMSETVFGGRKVTEIRKPSQLIYLAENDPTRYDSLYTTSNFPLRVGRLHTGATNLLWCDGHTDSKRPGEITANQLNN